MTALSTATLLVKNIYSGGPLDGWHVLDIRYRLQRANRTEME